jgi:hypothetical protein
LSEKKKKKKKAEVGLGSRQVFSNHLGLILEFRESNLLQSSWKFCICMISGAAKRAQQRGLNTC